MNELNEITLDCAREGICAGCGGKIESDQFPICDECLEDNDTYIDNLEKSIEDELCGNI